MKNEIEEVIESLDDEYLEEEEELEVEEPEVDESMSDGEVVANIVSQIGQSTGTYYSGVCEDRQKAFEYYFQEPFGNEEVDRSQVVTSEVSDTINWFLPSLMKIFTSGGQIAQFEASTEQDEEQAAQETDYVNYIFFKKCNGFQFLHDWFFNALLLKNGIAKYEYVEDEEVTEEEYSGLMPQQLEGLMADPELELTGSEEQMNEFGYSIAASFKRKKQTGHIQLTNIPPEEFYINPSYENLDLKDVPFVCHEYLATRTDLLNRGFDETVVSELSTSTHDDNSDIERDARFADLGGDYREEYYTTDRAGDDIQISDCYTRLDVDGDNVAELRHIILANRSVVLYNEECPEIPFVSITPVPVANRFVGRSIADMTMDIQFQKSTLLRNILDNVYFINNAETIVLEGEANIEDILTSKPRGILRETTTGAIRPKQVQPLSAEVYNTLNYFEQMTEARTGISKVAQGLDPNALNRTATGTQQMLSASQSRIELVARFFANGLARLLVGMHGLLLRNVNSSEIVKLRGKYVPVNPSQWKSRTDMSVSVGLGTSNDALMVHNLKEILGLQVQAKAEGMSNNDQVYNTLSKIVEASGLQNAESFFRRPTPEEEQQIEQKKQQASQNSPEAVLAQAQLQMTDRINQANIQEQQMRSQIDTMKIELDRQKAMAEIQLQQDAAKREWAELELSHQVDVEKLGIEAKKGEGSYITDQDQLELESEKAQAKLGVDVAELQLKAQAQDDKVVNEGLKNVTS